jgi:hypothetical protein
VLVVFQDIIHLLFEEIPSENFETSIFNLAIAESGDYIILSDTSKLKVL